ncbi:glutaminyl-peptide cyclotransferase isoform X1 [Drosophila yakuba]|uniref:glutaminyl-peptide cyclotransferase n=2 Tax=Drosophila yakuba TaxID=7245 RepID=B4PJ96_DROYA|nr:glutaminyl-peptide cyclotransferase isoform X1 [Drosophila yakuba]EDW93564.2 uncharacterized protein Dyak_GE20525 [Drosophila yakuba]
MLGRIALFLTIIYVVFNAMLLRWVVEKQPLKFADDEEHFNATLAKLLKPRYVGSQGHHEVRDFMEMELKRLQFTTLRNEFHAGGVNLTNLVGFWNMGARFYLMLTCHYDSKRPENGTTDEFLGATESAVSCAILLNVAKTLKPLLMEKWSKKSDFGLAFIFFDGHNPLSSDPYDDNQIMGSQHFVDDEFIPLENMAVAVTLSYIGAPNQTFLSYFEVTNDLHNMIADIEVALRKTGQLDDCHLLFEKKTHYDNDLLDDHISFDELDVPVLHVGPQEFPSVLYTAADNAENLHFPTIRNMIKIMRTFVANFFEMWQVFMKARNTFGINYDFYDD